MFDPFVIVHTPVRAVRRSSRTVIPNRRYTDSGADSDSDTLPSLEYTPVSVRNSGEEPRGMN